MKNKNLSWLKTNLKEFNFKVALLTFLSSLNAFFTMFSAVVTKWIIDILVGDKKQFVWVPLLIGIFVILVIICLRQLQNYLTTLYYGQIKSKLTLKFSKEVFEKDYQELSKIHSGELLNYTISDLNIIADYYLQLIPIVFSITIKLVLGVAFLAMIDWKLLLLCILVAGVCGIITVLLRTKIKNLSKKLQSANGKFFSSLEDAYQSIEVIKAYQINNFTLSKIDSNLQDYAKKLLKINNTICAVNSAIYGVFNIGFFAILIAGVAFLGANNNLILGIGSLTAMIQIFQLLKDPFIQLTSLVGAVMNLYASVERIMTVENMNDDKLFVKQKSDFDMIKCDNLTFAYDKEKVIDNLSFVLNKGEFVGVVGDSGAGKSTLLKILLGLLKPNSGEAYVQKGDKKTPLNTIQIGYVPQTSFTVAGSVKENLTLGANFSDEQIRFACEKAMILQDILSLQGQFDFVLGERGNGLSVGQNQRLAIARAILFDYDILILDEATSSLNEQFEKEILNNIKNMQKTVIMVTHNHSNLRVCDKVITLVDNN